MRLRLSDGREIPAPAPIDPVEFALRANRVASIDGAMVAVYDPTSSTGAVYFAASRRWMLQTPLTSTEFADWLNEIGAQLAPTVESKTTQ